MPAGVVSTLGYSVAPLAPLPVSGVAAGAFCRERSRSPARLKLPRRRADWFIILV